MSQQLDKQTETRPETQEAFSPAAAFVPQPAQAPQVGAGVLATQALMGNAAVAASPLVSQPADVSTLQSTFGNAAVERSATAGEVSTSPQPQITAQPAASVTTTITHAEPIVAEPTRTETVTDLQTPPIAESAPPPAAATAESVAPSKELARSAPTAQVPAAGGSPSPPAVTAKGAEPVKSEAKSEGKPGAAKAEAATPAKEKVATKEKGATDGGASEQAPPSPREAIAPTIGAVHQRAGRARKHSEPPGAPVDNAQAAAIKKGPEQERSAARQTVKNLDKAKDQTKPVPRDDFRAALKEAIRKNTKEPKTEGEADEVMKTGATKASSELRGQVSTQSEAAVGPLKSAAQTEAPPTNQNVTETKLQPEPLGAAPAPVSAAPVVPAPLPAERLDYSSDREPTDRAMAENDVSKEQLEKGNEPEFSKNLSERSNVEKQEAATEARYRKSEAQVQGQTYGAAHKELTKDLAGMHGARSLQIGKVVGQQNETEEKNAKERQRITDKITEIKNKTRTDVDSILKAMEIHAVTLFDLGLRSAEAAYESKFEEEKGGAWTWATTWGKSWKRLIERSLRRAREEYLLQVDHAIDQLADFVDGMLNAAKARVTKGLTDVENFVKGLDDSVKKYGEDALKEVTTDFEAMTGEIDKRRDNLVNALVDQYKASYKRMSEMEEKLREANKSLWEKIYDATVGLIKKIIAFKDMILDALARAADVIGMIISDPIGFLGNLVEAIGRGISNFADRIEEHLKQGLIDWLFGTMAEAGIQLPDNFDFKGILSLVMQILGLTYANIRARAVTLLGEDMVAGLETAAEIFKILITEGPAGVWEYVKEQIGDFKEMILEQVKSWVITELIKAGIKWLLSLLNPVAAFFKACMAIYEIVKFFIERINQIMMVVNAIIDSVAAIAKGNIDAAAAAVEKALAKAIPVILGFLAALLNISGITDAIKKIIESIRAPINKAIDWVIMKAVDMVKAVGGLLFGKEEPAKKEETKKTDDPEHDLKVEAGLAAIDQEDAKHLNKEGKISREEAEAVSSKVKTDHPVFKTLTLVESETTWDYEYSASPSGTKTGAAKETEPGDSEKNPIDFEWIKPAVANYPPVQLAPADEVAKATKALGRDLSPAEVSKLPKAFVAHPTQSTSLDDRTVGVTNTGSQTAPGFLFQAQAKVSGNSVKDAVNRKLEKFGYNREDNANPPTDGDHVMEKQLGGQDAENNVWPLNSSTNRSSGATMRSQIEQIGTKFKLKSIVGKFLRLKF